MDEFLLELLLVLDAERDCPLFFCPVVLPFPEFLAPSLADGLVGGALEPVWLFGGSEA